MMAEAAPPNGQNDDAVAEKSELQILQEENAVMRREIEALAQAKEIAREKVRVSSPPPDLIKIALEGLTREASSERHPRAGRGEQTPENEAHEHGGERPIFASVNNSIFIIIIYNNL
jgi:hypothetical protein